MVKVSEGVSIIAQGPAPAVVGVMARGWVQLPRVELDHQRHDESATMLMILISGLMAGPAVWM